MNTVAITCRDVTLAYGPDVILSGVNLDIQRGSFLPFVGPNGAGKTTLLRAILGLVPVRSGTIQTDFHKAPAGFVPQQHTIDVLFPVTARDIVMMGLFPKLGWWKNPGDEQRAKVESLLQRFNMDKHADKAFHELSGGMRQRILIARALAAGAEVLVMDEPTSALDEESEQEVLHLLCQLAREEGKAVLFAQHGLDLVRKLATEVCLVFRGAATIKPMSQINGTQIRGDTHVC